MRLITKLFVFAALISLGWSGSLDAAEGPSEVSQRITGRWYRGGQVRIFSPEGTFTVTYDGKTSTNGTWRIDGDTLFTMCVLDGNTIRLDEEIITVTEAKMVLKSGKNTYTYTR